MRRLIVLFLAVMLSSAAHAYCFKEAGSRYKVDPALLVAIAQTESRMNPKAVNHNSNGTEDIGLMQINSSWLSSLRRFGITRKHLEDPCVNVNVGAWVLAENFVQHGRTWKAVGAYNARSASKQQLYIKKVWGNLKQLSSS